MRTKEHTHEHEGQNYPTKSIICRTTDQLSACRHPEGYTASPSRRRVALRSGCPGPPLSWARHTVSISWSVQSRATRGKSHTAVVVESSEREETLLCSRLPEPATYDRFASINPSPPRISITRLTMV
ncbi:hypothetical protein NDU88_003530 [Pleurodeles waltl]|uniref:Uncharacterized protein n=1 Tax=Pleurodeles waltl TaxID=8319 RepID=A0AAV7VHP0_PLEWA|nr:hypothetical protein NDU88_003530 [Pleurodeles waltl]